VCADAPLCALQAYEDEASDDDFEGAVETHFEDPEMEEEADLKAQEEAEELKRQRIEGGLISVCPVLRQFLEILTFLALPAELGLTTAEAMTLAQQLVNRERTKTQLIDEGFNRNTSMVGGDGLPTWFIDDEQRHFRNNIPVTKEAVAAIREKLRALNARPIKKIAEAQARKKMRTIRRIEKTRAKAQGINDDEDNGLTEKEKANSIAKVLAKSKNAKPAKKAEIKVVVARGANKGVKGRPKGVKGRYKVRRLVVHALLASLVQILTFSFLPTFFSSTPSSSSSSRTDGASFLPPRPRRVAVADMHTLSLFLLLLFFCHR
jgi:AdoMet-dependent rRNA methyltransferase SPB1